MNFNDFADYQAATDDTALYDGQTEVSGLMYAGLGLAGEAGEVAGKIKKIWRDTKTGTLEDYERERVDAISDELGDVLWYVARVATELGLNLSDIAVNNINKLADRKKRGVLTGSGDKR